MTIINEKAEGRHRFTFKGGEGSRILFDSVRLWDCTESCLGAQRAHVILAQGNALGRPDQIKAG